MDRIIFTGDPTAALAACARAQTAVDSIKGKVVTLRLTKMQILHLYALGHIDSRGKRLVEMDVILAALRRYRERR